MLKKYFIKDVLKKIDRNKTTLIRWEEMGLLPEAKRDSRGWRYYTKNEINEIVDLIKTTNYFKDIFSKDNNMNNEIPQKINFLGIVDDEDDHINEIRKNFGYGTYLINSFKETQISLNQYFNNQKNKLNETNKFISKELKKPRKINLDENIIIGSFLTILFLASSFLFFNQPAKTFLANSLTGAKSVISYLNDNTSNFISYEAEEYINQFKEMTQDAGKTINGLVSLNMGDIPSFARNFEDKTGKGIMLFLNKTKNILLADLSELIKGEKMTKKIVSLNEAKQSTGSTLIIDKLKLNILETETEITIYDKNTGQSYCIKMENNKLINIKGECLNLRN